MQLQKISTPTKVTPSDIAIDYKYHLQIIEFSKKQFEMGNDPFLTYLAGMLELEIRKKLNEA